MVTSIVISLSSQILTYHMGVASTYQRPEENNNKVVTYTTAPRRVMGWRRKTADLDAPGNSDEKLAQVKTAVS